MRLFPILPCLFVLGLAVDGRSEVLQPATATTQPASVPAKYIGGIYSFTGTVETKMALHTFRIAFTGSATDQVFTCSWANERSVSKSTGTITVDKATGGSMEMTGMPLRKIPDPNLAIASATGVSSGSAHLMYGLWTGDAAAVFPQEQVRVVKTGDTTTFSGEAMDGSTKRTVTMEGEAVVSVVTEYDPTRASNPAPEATISDEQITETLKAMGKHQTPADIAEFRATLKSVEEARSQLTDVIVTTTTLSVSWPQP